MMKRDRGAVGIWVVLILIALAVFAGFQFGKAYLDHGKLEEKLQEIALRAIKMPRVKYEEEILGELDRPSIYFDEEEIEMEVDRERKLFTIYVPYTRYVSLLVTDYPMKFLMDREIQAKEGSFMQGVRESVEDSYERGDSRARKVLKDIKGKTRN